MNHSGVLKINMIDGHYADIVKQCLEVDEELQPTKISRTIVVQDNFLIIKFSATSVKLLRVAVSSIIDMLSVCAKTIMEFSDVTDHAN